MTSAREELPAPTSDPREMGPGAWRAVLARRLALLAFVMNVIVTPILAVLLSRGGRAEVATGGVVSAVALAIALRRQTAQRTRAWLLVASCAAMALGGYVGVGIVGGPAAALVVASIIAALLLGPRSTAAVLAVVAGAIALVAWAMITGRIPAPTPADTSPLSAQVWIRTAGVAFAFAGLAAAIVTWTVARIEASLERVRHEASRRRQAEDARRRAEHLALESQKLELVGRLAAGVAHDFNNHLTIIAMANGRLADGRLDDAARRAASQAIVDSIRSAGALSRQLLVLGRSAPRTLEHLALRDVVDAFLPSLQRVLPSDVALEVAHDGPVTVRADAVQLQQALLNFVVNARDAMPQGGRLVVRTRRTSLDAPLEVARGTVAPGEWGVLEVEDSGSGIDARTRERVFEPFFTTKPLDKGSGLGLSTVAMIADQTGGHVELDTAVDRGTRIALWLPALDGPGRDLEPASSPHPAASSLDGRTVLVVEDEPQLLEAARRVLGEAGCRVLAAGDGTAAMGLLAAHHGAIDLLCTDVVMPGTPVRDVIARFRELHPASPVLTCSGYVGEDLVRRGIEEGRYRLLQKPYAADDLLDAVAALLRGAAPPRPAVDRQIPHDAVARPLTDRS